MINNFRCVWLTLLLGVSAVVKAQVYSLDSCVAMAMRSNKEIQAAKHQVNQYQYKSKALYANFFPNITGLATDSYSNLSSSTTLDLSPLMGQYVALMSQLAGGQLPNVSLSNPTIDVKMKNLFTGGLLVEQPLYMGGKITAGYRMGKLGVQMAQLGEQLSREEMVLSVYEGYQQLVKAKEMRLVALQYDSLLMQLGKEVDGAVKHGLASRNDQLKVQVKKNDAELKIRQAENGIRLAKMNLCQLVGLPLDANIDTENDADTVLVAMVDKDARVDGRVEYQLLDLKTQLAEQKVKLERANFRPQLGLMAHAGVIDGAELMGKKLFDKKFDVAAGVVLKVPIFHANEGRNKVLAAKEELEQERLNQGNLVEKMNLELQQQANLVDEAMLELTLRQRNLEQCQENLRVSQKSYAVGLETLSDLLNAQLLWQQAYAELAESKYQAKTKMMQWRKAAGRLSVQF